MVSSGKSLSARGVTDRPLVLDHKNQATWRSWIWVLPVLTVVPYLFGKLHYSLPAAQPPYDASGRAQPSEQIVLAHVQALEDIGYRTVGTHEALRGEEYVLEQARDLERKCKGGILVCEVWEQIGSGGHSFSIADHDVLKLYTGVRNVIMRISAKDGSRGEKDAVLLGSHIDSTLPAPGAADDGLGVGVMLDLARVMVERNEPFNGSVIFVWNGAEETLQDGSHLYATQHETAKTVRAVINLEAAGTTGGALVFQATSQEMIEAYSKVPHPRGTAIASEIFASGIMISDTDFGQYERYLNVSGLDMALVGHSYFYHTRKDSIENISPGSAQHFGSNIQSVLDNLLGADSPLVSNTPWRGADLVYVSLFDRVFLKWPMSTADKVYPALAAVVGAVTFPRSFKRAKVLALAVVGTPLGIVGALVAANGWAAILSLIGWKQTWFINEHLPLILYVPIALIGYFSTQFGLSYFLSPIDRPLLEHAHLHAQLIYPTTLMLTLQSLRLRSAYVPALITTVLLIGAIGNEVSHLRRARHQVAVIWGYVIPMTAMVALCVEGVTSTLDIFTPLTGRMGKEAPAEHIIATISAVFGVTFFPQIMPIFHRIQRPSQRLVLLGLLGLSLVITAVFVSPAMPRYDERHPKRMAVQYSHNHTSNENSLRVAFLDQGDKLGLLPSIHERYGHPESRPAAKELNEYTPDWDIIYPISVFLDGYEFPLSSKLESEASGFKWPEMKHEIRSKKEVKEGRRIDMKLDFTDLIWPTIAFEAEILAWSFDFPPPVGKKRHHIKIVPSLLQPKVELWVVLKETGMVNMDWTAVDGKQMVPWTAPRLGPNMPASKLLLDLDSWAETKWKNSIDITGAGIVSGIVEI